MKTILFATGNNRKITEASTTLAPFDIGVTPIKLHFDEIQHHDPVEITKAKARAAYVAAGSTQPIVVSDTSWAIPALGNFPGGYMKDIGQWWSEQNWLAVMADQTDRRIFCLEHIAYYDGVVLQHFVEQYEGTFMHTASGRTDDSESFERVVSLYGDETMADQLGRGEVASAGQVLGHWQEFGKWYNEQA